MRCRILGHRWSHWRLKSTHLWYLRSCARDGCAFVQFHSVWECAEHGHTHP